MGNAVYSPKLILSQLKNPIHRQLSALCLLLVTLSVYQRDAEGVSDEETE